MTARHGPASVGGEPDIHALLVRVAPIVARAMTGAGHLAQIVTQEHRGNCRHNGCTLDCIEAQAVVEDLTTYLEEHVTVLESEVSA